MNRIVVRYAEGSFIVKEFDATRTAIPYEFSLYMNLLITWKSYELSTGDIKEHHRLKPIWYRSSGSQVQAAFYRKLWELFLLPHEGSHGPLCVQVRRP